MAYYDPNTNKIVGADKYSLSWFHEDRHRQQFNNTSLQKKVVLSEVLSFYGKLLIVAATLLRAIDNPLFLTSLFLSTILVLPDIIMTAYLEIDADSYALKSYNDYNAWCKEN